MVNYLRSQEGFTAKDILLDCCLVDQFNVKLASARVSQTMPCQMIPITFEPEV